MKKKILIVEDEINITELIKYNLEKEGFSILSAKDGIEGRELRKDGISVPIIMLTAKGEEKDKVMGLDFGADDYMTKPFGIKELMARIRAHLRRNDSEKIEKGFKETMIDISKKMSEGDNEATKMMAKILEKATYKVNKVEENGNQSELDVTIKAVDLTKYLTEFMASLKPLIDSNMGEEAFSKATVDYFSDLSKKELEYKETNVKVYMEKINGEWKVINTDDIVVGIFGGLEEFIKGPQN